jgi:hypothetical protein
MRTWMRESHQKLVAIRAARALIFVLPRIRWNLSAMCQLAYTDNHALLLLCTLFEPLGLSAGDQLPFKP